MSSQNHKWTRSYFVYYGKILSSKKYTFVNVKNCHLHTGKKLPFGVSGNVYLLALTKANCTLQNKRSPRVFNFWTFFQRLQSY